MDDAAYRGWWHLHLRVALDEPLTDQERAAYETGLAELDAEEMLAWHAGEVEDNRAQIAALEQECDRLRARRTELDREIAQLEAALREQRGLMRGAAG